MLKPVLVNGSEFGITNGQEWHYPNNSLNEFSQAKERRYSLRIAFAAYQHGTYRQNVLLDFRRCIFLQRICADYLPINDYARIQTATNYQLSQIPPKWNDLLAFYSPVLSHLNSREIMLSKIYPYPNQQNFFLTQNTLSEDRLTRRNYRGRMHEIITLEEIARQEQLSRYNQVSYHRKICITWWTLCTGAALKGFFYLHPLSLPPPPSPPSPRSADTVRRASIIRARIFVARSVRSLRSFRIYIYIYISYRVCLLFSSSHSYVHPLAYSV